MLPTTETLPEGAPFDMQSPHDATRFMLDAQKEAVSAVQLAAGNLSTGARAMAAAVRAGRSIHYAAAGSSGLMALADACELPGTFGISADAIKIHMAGGVPVDGRMPGDTEDDTRAAQSFNRQFVAGDVAIVLTASGTTPYAIEAAKAFKAGGATVIGIANNVGTALLEIADIPVCLATPPEIIAGSTRLGAGTAQKAALNLMSSLMGVELGHVYQGRMVNVVADNAKLVERSKGMVAQIAGVTLEQASAALSAADGNPKAAIVIAAGCSPERAQELLKSSGGHIGPCLETLKSNQDK